MQSKARTVREYMASLPADRRDAIQAVRDVIKANLSPGFEEGIQYGMIGYYVPHSVYPPGYHCDPKQPLPFAAVASQKNYMSIYLMCIYGSPEHKAWLEKAWAKTGKKLDMGKSCIRFKTIEDVALDVVGEAVKRVPAMAYIRIYETTLKATASRPGKPTAKKKIAKATKAKKATAKKTAKKATAKKTAEKATKRKASKAKAAPAKKVKAKTKAARKRTS